MPRADLLALTPDAVVALSNRGLVKRAIKEIAAGKGPEIREEDDGTVVGVFPDGNEARLPPGTNPADAPCTCPAPPGKPCRHRVAAILAYLDAYAGKESSETETTEAGASTPGPPSIDAWTPAQFSDEDIEALLAPATLARAQRLRKRGLLIEVRAAEAADTGDPVPTARLPTCTVRFLAPDLALARCDCKAGHGCEHVALAVWAFRLADGDAPEQVVDVARTVDAEDAPGEAAPAPKITAATKRLREAEDLVRQRIEELLSEGVAEASASSAQSFALTRGALSRAKAVWPAAALDEIAFQLDAWRRRSSLYRADELLGLTAEIIARFRVASQGGVLPPRHALGQGEAPSTELRHLNLIGLGARVLADGEDCRVRFLFVDPKSAGVLVLTRKAPGDLVGSEIGARSFAGSSWRALAAGRVTSQAAKRLADRALTLGQTISGTSIGPQTGKAWERLPKPLRVERLADLSQHHATRSPRMLRPHVLAEDVRVVRIAEIEEPVYDPARQEVFAQAFDDGGEPFLLRLAYRAATPFALEALVGALRGGPRWAAGEVRSSGFGFEIEPTSLICDAGVVVPDFAGPDAAENLSIDDLEKISYQAPRTQLEEACEIALKLLEEAMQRGLNRVSAEWTERVKASARRLEALGLRDSALRMEKLAAALTPAAWIDAAIRLLLTREASDLASSEVA